MPIRFRCAYCSQLMAISRRKAGTVVRCPKCAGEIIVPGAEPETEADNALDPSVEASAGPQAFDDPQFGQVFEQAVGASPSPAPGAGAAPPAVELPPSEPIRDGLFLPRNLLIVSIGIILFLFVVMFILGWVIGRATAPTTTAEVADRAGFVREGSESPNRAPDPGRNFCRA